MLVDRDGRARVLDFGVASVMFGDTTGNQMVGFVAYMPPECITNGTVGPYCELYSLGATLHELLTGRRLFSAETTMALVYKLVHKKVLAPSACNREEEPALDAIVMRALARDPAVPYANVEGYEGGTGELTASERERAGIGHARRQRCARLPDMANGAQAGLASSLGADRSEQRKVRAVRPSST